MNRSPLESLLGLAPLRKTRPTQPAGVSRSAAAHLHFLVVHGRASMRPSCSNLVVVRSTGSVRRCRWRVYSGMLDLVIFRRLFGHKAVSLMPDRGRDSHLVATLRSPRSERQSPDAEARLSGLLYISSLILQVTAVCDLSRFTVLRPGQMRTTLCD